MNKFVRQYLQIIGLAFFVVLLAGCSRCGCKKVTYAACSIQYHRQLRALMQENGGELNVVGDKQIILLPTSSVFIGHSENLSANGKNLLSAISRSIHCKGRWVLSITVYNAMFKSRRASKALAWQQGNVVMRNIWKNSHLSVAASIPKVAVRTCYKCQLGQSLIQLVTSG